MKYKTILCITIIMVITAACARGKRDAAAVPSADVSVEVGQVEGKPYDVFQQDAVVCFSQWGYYTCIDKDGERVWSFKGNDDPRLSIEVQALSDGNFVGYSESGGKRILIFNKASELIYDYDRDDIFSRTKYRHNTIHHDIIEITEGPWRGAIALLTNAVERITFQPLEEEVAADNPAYLNYPYRDITAPVEQGFLAPGIIVFDYRNGTVLWDWSMHGEPGDNLSFSRKLPYTRAGLKPPPPHEQDFDWIHANAIVHGIHKGRQYFLISSRMQSLITKIDIKSEIVEWNLGYHGDFELMENLNYPERGAASDNTWFFNQHAPEIISYTDDRLRLFLYDNGGDLENEWRGYSRLVEVEVDESFGKADIVFQYGSNKRDNSDRFYGYCCGDADLLPGGRHLLITTNYYEVTKSGTKAWIGILSYPEGELLWRASSTVGIYRADYYPSIYNTTWKQTGDYSIPQPPVLPDEEFLDQDAAQSSASFGSEIEITNFGYYLNPFNELAVIAKIEAMNGSATYVEYGTTTELGEATPPTSLNSSGEAEVLVLGLLPGTKYYLRPAVADSEGFIVYGDLETVTTGTPFAEWPEIKIREF